jgi:hypothetical protein
VPSARRLTSTLGLGWVSALHRLALRLRYLLASAALLGFWPAAPRSAHHPAHRACLPARLRPKSPAKPQRSKAPAPLPPAPNLRFNSDVPSARRLNVSPRFGIHIPPPRTPAALPCCWPAATRPVHHPAHCACFPARHRPFFASGCGSGTLSLLSCTSSAIISGNVAAFQGCGTLPHSA